MAKPAGAAAADAILAGSASEDESEERDSWAGSDVEVDAESANKDKTEPRSSKKKVKKQHIKKRTAPARPANMRCFVAARPARKANNSKFCDPHRATDSAILYQAKSSGAKAMETYQVVRVDPVKVGMAFGEFEESNPAGCFRKSLIDWCEFQRKYSKSTAHTQRAKQKLMSLAKFTKYWKDETSGIATDADCRVEFFRRISAGDDCEGEGAGKQLWVATGKTRFVDVTKKVEQELVEGSKRKKGAKESDIAALKTFIGSKDAAGATAFLNDKDGFNDAYLDALEDEAEADDAEETGASGKKQKIIDVDSAQTDMYTTLTALLDKEVCLARETVVATREAMTSLTDCEFATDTTNATAKERYMMCAADRFYFYLFCYLFIFVF